VEVWDAFKRLQAGIADKPTFIARARSILERHGNSAPNCSNLDPKCYAATLIAAREALALDLAAFAPIFPLQPDSKVRICIPQIVGEFQTDPIAGDPCEGHPHTLAETRAVRPQRCEAGLAHQPIRNAGVAHLWPHAVHPAKCVSLNLS
jgi:hypothetical protein